MMRSFKIILPAIAAVALLAGGCGKDEGGGGDPSKMTDDQVAEKMISLLEDMGKTADEAGGDCDKVAEKWEGLFEKNEDFIKEANKRKETIEEDEEKEKAFKEKWDAKMEKAAMGLLGVAMKCSDNEKIKALMEKFEG